MTASGLDLEQNRHRVLAAFSEFALHSEDLDAVLTEACRLVSEALGAERAKVMEIVPQDRRLFVRAGVGWAPDIVGQLRLPMHEHSSETFSIRERVPVIMQDVRTETRFELADFVKEAGVVALVNVPINLPGGTAYGLLEVDANEPREFGLEDTEFLRTYATLLGGAIDRLLKSQALRASEERFRQFGDASADVLWIRDSESLALEYVNPAFDGIYGTKLEGVLGSNHVRAWAELIVPEDREGALDHIRQVRGGKTVLHAFRIRRPSDGAVRWIRDTSFPLLDAEGTVQRIGGIGHDATEERELQDRLHVLVAELQHRTRNLMGVVRSVTDKTLSSSTSLADFQGRIRDRLNALARVNSLLSRLDGGRRITFDELILTELLAHGVANPNDPSSQVRLEGPDDVRLRSSTVQTLALGLHELATNALKYGALSRPEGRLDVTWALLNGSDREPRLRVEWRESGVHLADAPEDGLNGETATPARRGYGRELIERALPYQLKAETHYELTPQGVRCTITLPVSSTMDANGFALEDPHA